MSSIIDMMTSQAQPVLYFLSLALIGSGFLMALIGLLTLFSASKEHLGLISLVSLINHLQDPGAPEGGGGALCVEIGFYADIS